MSLPRDEVYVALQNNYWEKSPEDKIIAVQKCGNAPYEIAMRFAGCNLRCGLCFASGYSWPEKFLTNKRVRRASFDKAINDFKRIPPPSKHPCYNWFRVVGGEPLLNKNYLNFLFRVLSEISSIDCEKFNKGIIIQTNGIYLGMSDLSDIAKALEEFYEKVSEVKLVVEVSIKGTNADEFKLLTRVNNEKFFKYNLDAYFKLQKLKERFENFDVVAIAGFGISESALVNGLGKSKTLMAIIFKNNKPIYHPDFWSMEFETLYDDFVSSYSIKRFNVRKMPMYGIKDALEYGWVKRAVKQAKRIYGDRFYDKDYAGSSYQISEQLFTDIIEHFFYPGSQIYYSTLIR